MAKGADWQSRRQTKSYADVRELARTRAEVAVATLVEILSDRNAAPPVGVLLRHYLSQAGVNLNDGSLLRWLGQSTLRRQKIEAEKVAEDTERLLDAEKAMVPLK